VDRSPRRYKVEGQALYRQIGLAPDADFETVKAKVLDLKEKYAKDPKRCIKLEICEDKIMELRLRQASGGRLAMAGSASLFNSFTKDTDEAIAKANSAFQAPQWTKGLVKPASNKVILQYAKIIGGMFLFGGVLAPGFSGITGFVIMVTGMNNLYRRGRPKQAESEEGMPQGQDMPKAPEAKKMFGIALATTVVAVLFNEVVLSQLVIPTLLEGKFAKDRCLCACFTLASLAMSSVFYVYPQKKAKVQED